MFDKLVKVGIVVIAIGVIVGLVAYFKGPSVRDLPPILDDLAENVSTEFAEKLPRTRDVNDLLLIVPRKGNPRDEEKQFRTKLKNKIDAARKYNVKDWEDVKGHLGDTWLGKLYEKTGLVPGDDPKNLEEAVKVLKVLSTANQTFDGVLVATIEEFQEGQAGLGAKVAVKGEIYSVAAAKTVETMPSVSDEVASRLDYRYLHHTIASSTFIGRFFLWFVVAATQPFALIQVVRAVVRRRQNELNLALIAGFTIVDVVLAWICLTSISTGGFAIFLLLLVAAGMGYYNYDACDYIERRLT